jgi:Tfp pilus assembly protein PilN
MKAVNLLPPDRPVARVAGASAPITDSPQRGLLIACAVLGIVTIAGLSTAVWSSNSSVSQKKKQLQAIESQISSVPAAGVQSGTASDASIRAQTINGIVRDRLVWDHFLQTLSKVVPEDVWLQSMQVTTAGAAATLAQQQAAAAAAAAAVAAAQTNTTTFAPTAPPAAALSAGNTFTVTGFTYSHPSVARMMRRLDVVPWLQGVSLTSSSKSAIGNNTIYQFTVTATVIPTPEGA